MKNFSYIFINRNICKTLLTIDKKDINNIILKKDVNITTKINTPHKCNGIIANRINCNEIMTDYDYINLTNNLIKLNPEKSLGWHIQKL